MNLLINPLTVPNIADADDYERYFNDDVWREVCAIICQRHKISYRSLRRSSRGENIIFFVDASFVIKIFAPFRNIFRRERAALEFAEGKLGLATPKIIHAGEIEGAPYILMTHLAGINARDVWANIELGDRLEIVSRLGLALRELHAYAAPLHEESLNGDWQGFIRRQADASFERQRACGANPEWLESLPAYVNARLCMLPAQYRPVFLHGDVHPGNILLSNAGGRWQITGLCDFSDSLSGFHEYEFVAPGVLMVQGSRDLQRALLLAYGYKESELDAALRARLMLLTILYECSDLRKYALRLSPKAINLTLRELEAAIWRFASD